MERQSCAEDIAECNRGRTASRDAGGTGRVVAARSAGWAALALALAAAAVWAGASAPAETSGARRGPLPAYASIERDGLRYEFEALRGRERVFEIAPDGTRLREVTDERRDAAARLRAALAAELGVDDLDRLVEEHREAAESLRALGYL